MIQKDARKRGSYKEIVFKDCSTIFKTSPVTLIMVHAQDHLMNAILMKDMANSSIKLNQKVAAMI